MYTAISYKRQYSFGHTYFLTHLFCFENILHLYQNIQLNQYLQYAASINCKMVNQKQLSILTLNFDSLTFLLQEKIKKVKWVLIL